MSGLVRKQDQALIDQFIAWGGSVQQLRPRTLEPYRQELEHLARAKGSLLHVTASDLIDFDHQRGGSDATRARRYAALNKFFRYMISTGKRKVSPVGGLKRPSVSQPIRSPVTDVASRLGELPDGARTAAEFILETGLRLGEFESISVRGPIGSQVRVVGRGGKRRLVDLSSRARSLLEQMGGRMSMRPRTLENHLRKVSLAPEVLRQYSLRTAPIPPLHHRLERQIRRLIEQQEGDPGRLRCFPRD
jgi:site-specific recombinase XerC